MSSNFGDINKLLNEVKSLAKKNTAKGSTGNISGHTPSTDDSKNLEIVGTILKLLLTNGEITPEDMKALKDLQDMGHDKKQKFDDKIREYDTYYGLVDEQIEEELKSKSVEAVARTHGWKKFRKVTLPTRRSWFTLPKVVRKGTWNTLGGFNYNNQHCGFWEDINPALIFLKGVDDKFGNTVEQWFTIVYNGKYYMERDTDFIVLSSEWNSKKELSPRYTIDRMYK